MLRPAHVNSRSGQHFGLDRSGGAGESDQQVGMIRVGKMTPNMNSTLTSNPEPKVYHVVMCKMTQKPTRLARNCPKTRGRVDQISRLSGWP